VSENEWNYISAPSTRLHGVDRNKFTSHITQFSLAVFQESVLYYWYFGGLWLESRVQSATAY
jgi:hypothetical protein